MLTTIDIYAPVMLIFLIQDLKFHTLHIGLCELPALYVLFYWLQVLSIIYAFYYNILHIFILS